MKFVSQIVTAASGKVRGLVASHNKGGQYFRGKTIPTNPNTPGQVAQRGRLSTLMSRWRGLPSTGSPAARVSWDLFAANVTTVDTLGNTISLSGNNWYVACNSIRMQQGLSIIDQGPTTYAMASIAPFTGTITAASTNLTLAWAVTSDWNGNSTTAGVNIYASRPQNPGVNYFSGPYQYAGSIRSTLAAGTALLALPFGTVSAGSKVFLRAVATAADGRLSPEFRVGLVA